jgi:hypothetical protein
MPTLRERIAIRALWKMAESFADSQGSDNADCLFRMAMMQAEAEIGETLPRNPVAMCAPIRAILNGKNVLLAPLPKGDDGPRITE